MATSEYQTRFQYEENGQAETEQFQFQDTDIDVLKRFVAYFEEMTQLGIDPAKMPINLHVSYDSEQRETQVNTNKPHPLVLSGFANAMRPFVLEKESTSFHKVLKIVRESCLSSSFRYFTQELARWYKSRQTGIEITLRAGEKVISQDQAFTMWLNAYIYHRDPEKRDLFQSFCSAVPWDVQETLFQMLFINKAGCVKILAQTIKHILQGDSSTLIIVIPKAVENQQKF